MSETTAVGLSPYKLTRPLGELRWLRDTDDLEPTMRLQQAWEVVEYGHDNRPLAMEIEWQDVPIVDEQLTNNSARTKNETEAT